MLKNFLCLNEDSLESYLSAIEDGARGAVSHASGYGELVKAL